MNTIIINGKKIQVSGRNISVVNNNVIVDGVVIETGLTGIVKVEFQGDLASLQTSGDAVVHGQVLGNVSASGDIECGSVKGDIRASGDIKCGTVGGNVRASGDVFCKK
ncbi:hypothetical protein EEL31_08580 [Brevibacillus laterosporus]|nr:polymer-forming cytoskeletal protein [Brevibacillus laterosporus]TPG68567.1 hypothetical protein EEL31_08580 [Brevibacillus laterosporus]